MPTTDPFPRGSGAPLRTSSVGAPEPDVRRVGGARPTSMSLMDIAVGAPGRMPPNSKRDGVVCPIRAVGLNCSGYGANSMGRVGLLGRSGAAACPNLLQRRPGPGSAARRSPEYQRFPFGAPARSGPLQQIWTTGALAGPGRGAAGRPATTTGLRTGPALPSAGGPRWWPGGCGCAEPGPSPARADTAALTGQGGDSGPAPPARADRATPAPRLGA